MTEHNAAHGRVWPPRDEPGSSGAEDDTAADGSSEPASGADRHGRTVTFGIPAGGGAAPPSPASSRLTPPGAPGTPIAPGTPPTSGPRPGEPAARPSAEGTPGHETSGQGMPGHETPASSGSATPPAGPLPPSAGYPTRPSDASAPATTPAAPSYSSGSPAPAAHGRPVAGGRPDDHGSHGPQGHRGHPGHPEHQEPQGRPGGTPGSGEPPAAAATDTPAWPRGSTPTPDLALHGGTSSAGGGAGEPDRQPVFDASAGAAGGGAARGTDPGGLDSTLMYGPDTGPRPSTGARPDHLPPQADAGAGGDTDRTLTDAGGVLTGGAAKSDPAIGERTRQIATPGESPSGPYGLPPQSAPGHGGESSPIGSGPSTSASTPSPASPSAPAPSASPPPSGFDAGRTRVLGSDAAAPRDTDGGGAAGPAGPTPSAMDRTHAIRPSEDPANTGAPSHGAFTGEPQDESRTPEHTGSAGAPGTADPAQGAAGGMERTMLVNPPDPNAPLPHAPPPSASPGTPSGGSESHTGTADLGRRADLAATVEVRPGEQSGATSGTFEVRAGESTSGTIEVRPDRSGDSTSGTFEVRAGESTSGTYEVRPGAGSGQEQTITQDLRRHPPAPDPHGSGAPSPTYGGAGSHAPQHDPHVPGYGQGGPQQPSPGYGAGAPTGPQFPGQQQQATGPHQVPQPAMPSGYAGGHTGPHPQPGAFSPQGGEQGAPQHGAPQQGAPQQGVPQQGHPQGGPQPGVQQGAPQQGAPAQYPGGQHYPGAAGYAHPAHPGQPAPGFSGERANDYSGYPGYSNATDGDGKRSRSTGKIVLAVIGGLVLLAVLGGVLYYLLG